MIHRADTETRRTRRRGAAFAAALATALVCAPVAPASAQVTAFKQAVAETAARQDAIADHYRENAYAPIWTAPGEDGRARREALLNAFATAPAHGLPAARYDVQDVLAKLRAVQSERDRGRVEVELSRLFVRFARDIGSGVLTPRDVDAGLVRDVDRRNPRDLLREVSESDPRLFLRDLMPTSPEYRRLLKEKMALERVVERGGYGAPVPGGRLERGDSGDRVVALRNRLIAMGYLRRTATAGFDAAMEEAVRTFQRDHGLSDDGVVGDSTLAALNRTAVDRLGSVLVALERERWLPRDRGKRHVWVNLTDFKARLIDEGQITFETRSVIGKNQSDRRTPEFSDVMDHMVINPSWYVPRSIVVNEYLPQLQRNPYALSHMEITDRRGRVVNRAQGFAQYTASTFPFSMRQPPSNDNALGLVKFMFPNRYNIYLHDTPAKSLFSRQERDFSHGCIRLNDPFEFAYELLSRQEADPQSYFHRILDTGRETRVELETPVPVHLGYRTAITKPTGGMEYRNDIYGRDAKILAALRAAGVAMPAGES